MPPSCLTWAIETARALEVAIMKTGLSGFCEACMAVVDFVGRLRPDLDRLIVLFVVGDEALIEETVKFVDLALRLIENVVLGLRHHDVADRHGRSRKRCVMEAELLDRVEEARRFGIAVAAVAVRNRLLQAALVDDAVDELVVPPLRERPC